MKSCSGITRYSWNNNGLENVERTAYTLTAPSVMRTVASLASELIVINSSNLGTTAESGGQGLGELREM